MAKHLRQGKSAWREAEFLAAATSPSGWPRPGAAEIALAGRSNVGKSSLLNSLVGRKALARVSSTPGRTRQIVFFSLTPELTLVDLPGYGFAKRSKAERQRWGEHLERYFTERKNLSLVIVLIDARLGPTELDELLLTYAQDLGIAAQVVFTKCDKLPKSRRKKTLEELGQSLPGVFGETAIAVSSHTGEGIEELRRLLYEFVPSRR